MWGRCTLSGRDRFGDWAVNSSDGWDDAPDTKGETVSVPNGDGEMDLPVHNEARLITVTGRIIADSHAQLHEAGLFLTGPLAGRFQVAGHGPTQWADTTRRAVKFKTITDRLAQWQLSLKAVDPVKYGDTKDFAVPSGNTYVNLYHRGNYLSLPILVITGSMPGGYRIQSAAGAEYRVTRALAAGAPHTIDMRDGMLQVNGEYVSDGIDIAGIWRISPGNNQTIRIVPVSTGTATMTAYVTDSYT